MVNQFSELNRAGSQGDRWSCWARHAHAPLLTGGAGGLNSKRAGFGCRPDGAPARGGTSPPEMWPCWAGPAHFCNPEGVLWFFTVGLSEKANSVSRGVVIDKQLEFKKSLPDMQSILKYSQWILHVRTIMRDVVLQIANVDLKLVEFWGSWYLVFLLTCGLPGLKTWLIKNIWHLITFQIQLVTYRFLNFLKTYKLYIWKKRSQNSIW